MSSPLSNKPSSNLYDYRYDGEGDSKRKEMDLKSHQSASTPSGKQAKSVAATALNVLKESASDAKSKEAAAKKPFPAYSVAFSKTTRALKVQELIRSKEFHKILPFLHSLSSSGRLNYDKHGETLSTFVLKFNIHDLKLKDMLKVIEQFHLAGANFKKTDGEGISPVGIVQASSLNLQVKEDIINLLKTISSECFFVSAEFSNSKKATTLQKYVDDQNFKGLTTYLKELNKENKLQYIKNGETLLNHFLKGSIHSNTSTEVLHVIDAFNQTGYSFDFADERGLVPIHIVMCSSISMSDKKLIIGRLMLYGASCEYSIKGITTLQTIINNITTSEKPQEWLDLLVYLLKSGANPNYGNIHPLTYAMTTLTDIVIKSKVIGAFLETNLSEVSPGSKSSQAPLSVAILELMSTKNDETFSTVFKCIFPLIMRNADKAEKQAILASEIQVANGKDPKKTLKLINAIYSSMNEDSHYILFKILVVFAPNKWLESFFKNSKSDLIINELAKKYQLSPELFKVARIYNAFSDEKVIENLRKVNLAGNVPDKKVLICHIILRMSLSTADAVTVLLFNIENLQNHFNDDFVSRLLVFLVRMKPAPDSLAFLNGILSRLTDLDSLENNTFSTQNEILNVLQSPMKDWVNKLDNLAARIYHAKYPEKPLDEVIANFKKMEFGLTDKELLDLGNCYQQIIKFSREKKIQDYSELEVGRALKTLSTYPPSLSADSKIDDRSVKSNYDRLTACVSLLRQAIYKSEGYLLHNTQVLVVLAMLKYNGRGRLAQVNTGEGKSSIVAMVAAYYSLMGNSVDVVTTSDGLAKRDAEAKTAFYKILGLNVKHNCVDGQTHEVCYKGAHIVYGTPYRFESSILHDLYSDEIVRGDRKSQVVIVDEVDSMFLDKGSHSTRLIFSDSRFEGLFWAYFEILACLKSNKDITPEAVKKALLSSQYYNTSTEFVKEKINTNISDWLDSAKTALFQYAENKHYIVQDGEILPVDFKHTGSVETRTRYSKGLHQFLEIKHKIIPKPEKNMGPVAFPMFHSF